MSVATWQAGHSYTEGDLANPTVANGHTYRCTVGGTSGSSEPTWIGRFGTITDGSTVRWVVYTVLTPTQIRTQLNLNDGTTGQYSEDVVGGYLVDAISSLEQAVRGYLVNRPGWTYAITSMGRPILPLPRFRTVTSVTWMGAVQTAGTPGSGSGGYQLLPDALQTGVYTGIQFRPVPITAEGPWWLALGGPTSNWFDTAADNPFDPRNYGAAIIFTSTPQDTVVVGDAGYEPGFEPGDLVHALGVLAGWYVMRPPAILADSAITASGGIVTYSQMPPEVQQFVKMWAGGQQVVSIG